MWRLAYDCGCNSGSPFRDRISYFFKELIRLWYSILPEPGQPMMILVCCDVYMNLEIYALQCQNVEAHIRLTAWGGTKYFWFKCIYIARRLKAWKFGHCNAQMLKLIYASLHASSILCPSFIGQLISPDLSSLTTRRRANWMNSNSQATGTSVILLPAMWYYLPAFEPCNLTAISWLIFSIY